MLNWNVCMQYTICNINVHSTLCMHAFPLLSTYVNWVLKWSVCSYLDTVSQWQNIILVEGVNPTGNEIGSGTFGKVFEVDYEGTLCAAKEIHEYMTQQLDKEMFLNHCLIWSTIRHPHIVPLLGLTVYIILIAGYILYILQDCIILRQSNPYSQ